MTLDSGVVDYGPGERAGFGARLGRKLRAAMLPVMFLAACFYFLWHAVHGERGLLAKEARLQQIAEAATERDRAQSELAAMERRVQALRGDRLDRDQLDERARQLLNMVGRDEMVLPYGPERRLF
ncbi:FtsB family cell division protein [Falsiroseomonas sp. CW058]|uniref:FtsB family cell division protein n=1 Tax=Falsiroseomonas sp. CW058 TaxID=3388664 RepID=UPI003D31F5D4